MERKARPSLRRDSGMNFPPATHPENASHSEPIFWDAVSVGRPLGKRVPPCVAVAFSLRPRPAQSSILRGVGDPLGRGAPAGIRSTSRLFRVDTLRGESAYLLRKSAPASAACRRPRPRATNASRLLNARALHRVRFSAVRTRNKKAGRYEYLPACYLWWSWRSFGRTPRHLDL